MLRNPLTTIYLEMRQMGDEPQNVKASRQWNRPSRAAVLGGTERMEVLPALAADSFATRACHSGNPDLDLDLRQELTKIRW